MAEPQQHGSPEVGVILGTIVIAALGFDSPESIDYFLVVIPDFEICVTYNTFSFR